MINPHLRVSPRSRGFSIVEMMVAVVISLILMGGIIQIFASSKATYQASDELSRLQENARFAMEAIVRDIRMAGYFGCMDNVSNVYDHLSGGTGGALLDTSSPIDGFDDNDPTKWQSSGNTTDLIPTLGGSAAGDMVSGNDAFTVRYLDGANPITVTTPYMPQASGDIKTNVNSGLKQGDIVAISDCSSADVFQISGPTDPSSTGNIVHNTGNSTSPGNVQAPGVSCTGGGNKHCLSKIYEGDATVAKLIARRYYIGRDAKDGTPSLFREDVALAGTTASPSTAELVYGVENMQLLYGEDTNGDKVPDTYLRADQVNWANVVSVRVSLLVRTPDEVRRADDLDTKSYLVGDETIGTSGTNTHPKDRRYRHVFQTTALMRNLQ